MTAQEFTRTEEEYSNLLGMLGLVLGHVGGKVEIPFQEMAESDLTTKEFRELYDQVRNVFVFELTDINE